jgi:hypothetical protein
MNKTKKQYPDTLFRTLFGEEKTFLDLYNALSGSHFAYAALAIHPDR